MAEFLVRVTSKANAKDVYKDVKLTKRGDVIAVFEDGHKWALMELMNPDWRIFRWPSVSVPEGGALLAQEQPTSPTLPGMPDDPMLQRRGFGLNLDFPALPADLKAFIADNTRKVLYYDVPATIKLSDLKYQKAPRTNPTTIG